MDMYWRYFEYLWDDQLNGSIYGIPIGLYERSTDETLIIKFYYAVKQAPLDNLYIDHSMGCYWDISRYLYQAILKYDKMNVANNIID